METFIHDELHQSAVLQKLIVIGEAVAHLSPAFRQAYPEVVWTDIVGFRTIAVHIYFSVDWKIVWTTAIKDVPSLRQKIERILAQLFDDEPSD
jgi:uncharacterized protein with HEPN domain